MKTMMVGVAMLLLVGSAHAADQWAEHQHHIPDAAQPRALTQPAGVAGGPVLLAQAVSGAQCFAAFRAWADRWMAAETFDVTAADVQRVVPGCDGYTDELLRYAAAKKLGLDAEQCSRRLKRVHAAGGQVTRAELAIMIGERCTALVWDRTK